MAERDASAHAMSAEPPAPADEPGFRRVFEHYAPRLRGYFLRHGASVALCDELVQEVMLTVWKKGELFDPERGSLSTWIYTIARNRYLDRLRQVRVEPDPEDPVWLGDRPTQTAAPDTHAIINERRVQLRQAVDQLPPELRELLIALYYEGKSMAEVATDTGVPLGTIKTRARRALAALRSSVTGEDP